MPADFFYPGAVELYVKTRKDSQFNYLGTCVTSPLIEVQYFHDDALSDKSGSAPWQKIEGSEQHLVTATLNRLNFETLNLIRARNKTVGKHKVLVGDLVYNVHDFLLFIQHSLPSAPNNFPSPAGAAAGRLYYSATLLAYTEATDTRVREVTVLVECNPLYDNFSRELTLYSESPSDFPTITKE